MSQIARGFYKAAVTFGQISKPSGIGCRELILAWRLRLAEQNTSRGKVLRRIGRNLWIVYPGLEEKTYKLTYL